MGSALALLALERRTQRLVRPQLGEEGSGAACRQDSTDKFQDCAMALLFCAGQAAQDNAGCWLCAGHAGCYECQTLAQLLLLMQSSLAWACSGAAAPPGGGGETLSALGPAGAGGAARGAAMRVAGMRGVVEDEGVGLDAACRQESSSKLGCCDVRMLCWWKLCAGSAGCCRAQGTVENLKCAPAYAARTHLRGRQRGGSVQSGWLWDLGSWSWWTHQDRWSWGVCWAGWWWRCC